VVVATGKEPDRDQECLRALEHLGVPWRSGEM